MRIKARCKFSGKQKLFREKPSANWPKYIIASNCSKSGVQNRRFTAQSTFFSKKKKKTQYLHATECDANCVIKMPSGLIPFCTDTGLLMNGVNIIVQFCFYDSCILNMIL
jgi:hypothetical protein